MTNEPVQAGELIDARPLGSNIVDARHRTLLNTDSLTIKRMVLLKEKQLAEHVAPGDIVIQCIEGRFLFSHSNGKDELLPGQMIHLSKGDLHAVKAIEDSSFLLFIFARS